MVDQTCLLSVRDQTLLSRIEGRENLLEAYNVEIIELFDEFIQPCIFKVRGVSLDWRRPHEHVVRE